MLVASTITPTGRGYTKKKSIVPHIAEYFVSGTAMLRPVKKKGSLLVASTISPHRGGGDKKVLGQDSLYKKKRVNNPPFE